MRGPKIAGLRRVSLTFGACRALTRPFIGRMLLFDPPPGPGDRRPTPDSAVRPRARTCLDDPHPEEPRSGVSKDEATAALRDAGLRLLLRARTSNRTAALFD